MSESQTDSCRCHSLPERGMDGGAFIGSCDWCVQNRPESVDPAYMALFPPKLPKDMTPTPETSECNCANLAPPPLGTVRCGWCVLNKPEVSKSVRWNYG